jgi:hypothetical protein
MRCFYNARSAICLLIVADRKSIYKSIKIVKNNEGLLLTLHVLLSDEFRSRMAAQLAQDHLRLQLWLNVTSFCQMGKFAHGRLQDKRKQIMAIATDNKNVTVGSPITSSDGYLIVTCSCSSIELNWRFPQQSDSVTLDRVVEFLESSSV